MPGYAPLPVADGALVAPSSAWRGKWPDITQFYQLGGRPYDPVNACWLCYDSEWNGRDPNGFTFAGGDPVNFFDPDGRIATQIGNQNPANQALNGAVNYLNNYADNTESPVLGGAAAFLSQLFGEAQSANNPGTYANGVGNFANNINTVYQSGGAIPATSYALTSWNMGAVMAGVADQNQLTGASLGSGWDQAESIFQGVGGTAGIATAGVSFGNAALSSTATVSADVPPVISTTAAETTLPPNIAATFSGGQYTSTVLEQDMIAYRYSGGISQPVGSFLTTADTVSQISSPVSASIALNIPAGATAETLNTFTIPAGTQIFTGGVAGGADSAAQIFIQNPSVLIPH